MNLMATTTNSLGQHKANCTCPMCALRRSRWERLQAEGAAEQESHQDRRHPRRNARGDGGLVGTQIQVICASFRGNLLFTEQGPKGRTWKASIRVDLPGERPPIGRWLELNGGMEGASLAAKQKGGHRKDQLDYHPVTINWPVDRCAVCDDDRFTDQDEFVVCEGCKVVVHQSCYGIEVVPDPEIGWLCRVCESTGGAVAERPRCCLCPAEGGALMPSADGLWAHNTCAEWIPEVEMGDPFELYPIGDEPPPAQLPTTFYLSAPSVPCDDIGLIPKDRWDLRCTICKQRQGAKIQCEQSGCYLAFHVTCARAAGFHLDLVPSDSVGPGEEVLHVRQSWCHRHRTPDLTRIIMEGYTPLGAAGTTAPTGVGATEGVGLAAEHLLEPPRSESGCARCREYAPLGHPRTEAVAMEEVQVEMPSTPAPLEPTRAAKPAALPVPKKPLPSYLKIQPGKADAVKVKAGAGITPTPTP
eukprot:gene14313-16925_t